MLTLASTQAVSHATPDLSVRLMTLMGGAAKGFSVKVTTLESPSGDVNSVTWTMTAAANR